MMTRDEFFLDVAEALRLLGRLGVAELSKTEIAQKVAAMRAGGVGFTPDDLRRYANAIDWSQQTDARPLAELAPVLLRLVPGLGSELESFRRTRR